MRKILLFICLAFTTFSSVDAIAESKTWYVSGNGNDANSGGLKHPFRSLQKAADIVQPGDIVLIGNGIYTGNNGGNWFTYKTSVEL